MLRKYLPNPSTVLAFFMGAILVGSHWVWGFTEPTLAPPTGNTLPPITTSSITQTKSGTLIFPAFLDSTDTTWYVNPNDTSRLNLLYSFYMRSFGSAQVDANLQVNGNLVVGGTITGGGLYIGTSQLKTAIGSAVITNGTQANVTMNDYSFFPSITNALGCCGRLASAISTAPGDTTGRIHVIADAGSGDHTVRWRYITASDRPTIWAIVNADGSIATLWESEDPVLQFEYPKNPNPFEGTLLADGQRFASVEPLAVAELQNIFIKLPAEDQAKILTVLRTYLVSERGWLSAFNDLGDLSYIAERYHPASRFWAMRLIAKYYGVDTSMLIIKTMTVSVSDMLQPKTDFYTAIQNYLEERQRQ